MLCPACLQQGTSAEAVSQVNGTLFCAQHAIDALSVRERGPSIRFSAKIPTGADQPFVPPPLPPPPPQIIVSPDGQTTTVVQPGATPPEALA